MKIPGTSAAPRAPHEVKANWHAIVALGVVIGAEIAPLKTETAAQLAAHTWIFWAALVVACVVGYGNSRISTAKDAAAPSAPAPDKQPAAPAPTPPASGALKINPEALAAAAASAAASSEIAAPGAATPSS